jgi:hypothetical protein
LIFRKRHVRRADLQRDNEISEGGERERHDAEKIMIVPCIAPNEL